MANVAVLGTGLLGSGFVENLLRKGHSVRVWNRTASKLAPLVEEGAIAAASPAEAVEGAERVHLVLTSDDAVDSVIAALRPALGSGVPLFDHSTNLPARVEARTAALHAAGVRYASAPVFMSPQNAREATGLMLLAASEEDAAAWAPILSTMTGKLWHVGAAPGLAAAHKLAGNGVLVSLAGVMGDLFSMGAANGLSPEQVLSLFEVFKPAASLPFIGGRVAARGTKPASFELQMARKDVRLMIESAGGPEGLVVLPAVAAAMDHALDQGLAEKDFAVYAWPRGRA